MIDVQQYRVVIGCFCQSRKMRALLLNRGYKFFIVDIVSGHSFRAVYLLLSRRFPKCFTSFLMLILLLAGDVELNPGPLNILKSVHGTFHQGDVNKLGIVAGTQCMCNVLFALCFSSVKKVCYWRTYDLDYILREGTNLYKSWGYTNEYLSVNDLPTEVGIENTIVKTEKLQNEVLLLISNQMDYNLLQRSRNSKLEDGNGMICIIRGISFAILWDSSCVYIFDSHSRDALGRISENGTSVLLKLSNLQEAERFIERNYVPPGSSQYLEIQYIKVLITPNEIVEINASVGRKRIRERNKIYSEFELGKMARTERNKRYRSTENGREKQNEACKNFRCSGKRRKNRNGLKQVKKNNRVEEFRQTIKNGPYYICVICNRCLYKRSVRVFDESKYQVSNDLMASRIESFDNNEYICETCHSKLKKGHTPCQAVFNKLEIFELPNELSDLRNLEKVLIAKRLLFKKIAIMHGKGEYSKIKGTICNVPIESDDICNVLPRGISNNGIIKVILKKKINFKSNVYLESVRPTVIHDILLYLKENNHLYANTNIATNIRDVLETTSNDVMHDLKNEVANEGDDENIDIDFVCDKSTMLIKNNDIINDEDLEEEEENPLDQHRLQCSETAFVSNIPHEIIDNESISIAPGQDKTPIAIVYDENCEELAHPYLFPTGKFGYTVKRYVKLSPVKYFNQRLLNYKQKFSSDSDYIFFVQSVTQHLNLNSRINIAMQKVKADGLTAGMLSTNFKERVQSFIAHDDAFTFMNTIKGTPAYWKKFLFEVLAMVKQLGLPTFFMTLSCADLHWNELVEIITKLNGREISEKEISNLNYFERTKILNSNPVLLARHFQYRVETFFKYIVIDGPLGKVQYYAIRVEF